MHRPGKPHQGLRGGAFLTIIALLALSGILFLWFVYGHEQQRRASDRVIVMSDPTAMLRSFFIELGRDTSGRHDPEQLLAFMSTDDRDWFENHHPALAAASGRSDPPRRAALAWLLDYGPHQQRPVISQLRQDGAHGVVYIHPPGNAAGMSEVFIVNELDGWRIRRFLGARDRADTMQAVIAARQAAGGELTDEERLFLENPAAHAKEIRARLLAESGAPPRP